MSLQPHPNRVLRLTGSNNFITSNFKMNRLEEKDASTSRQRKLEPTNQFMVIEKYSSLLIEQI